ncbi:MAG: hypothetical protein GYB53_21390 [Rhodobacteraceae bacterium]|nr:hypothetical protein [Paracoccaceae bacterium]MBR9823059.1 hypothetical protein [Paracoccaceae bacterium]
MSDTTELSLLPDAKDLPAVFTEAGKLDELITSIEERVKSEVIDVTTPKGRKAATSLAAKVSSSKVLIEKTAKDLTEDWRQKTANVNALKKSAVERLEKLRDDTKAPVKEWEEKEEARVRAILQLMLTFDTDQLNAAASSEELQALIDKITAVEVTEETFQEKTEEAEALKAEALKVYGAHLQTAQQREENERELAALRAEKEERERQDRERAEKEAAAKAEEERKAREAEEKARREQEAKEAQERAAKEAEARAEQQRQEAEARHARELEEAKRREDEAAQRERDRIAQEQREKEEAEAAALADAENRQRVKATIVTALGKVEPRSVAGMVEAMMAGEIPHVKVYLDG